MRARAWRSLATKAGLLELADRAEDLAHHFGGRRRVGEVGRRISRDQLDVALAQQRMTGELDDQVAGEPRGVLRQHNADVVAAQYSSRATKPGRLSTGSALDTAAS
jgi:hypothetical protein